MDSVPPKEQREVLSKLRNFTGGGVPPENSGKAALEGILRVRVPES